MTTDVVPIILRRKFPLLLRKSWTILFDVTTYEDVDDYLAGVASDDARAALSALRAIIRDEAPDAEETISYGIPTYKLNGYLASFAAFKRHCSFFPGHTVRDFTDALKEYKTSKGTIQFPPNKPLPESLVRAMIRARMDENRSS
jgi:uncharacterized protein YdhG (YjbR/CyaY superfamily)